MDDRLEQLRREHEGSPGDVALAKRYEAALVRAGERGAAQDLYRFKFQCPLNFMDDLRELSPHRPHVRRCDDCAQDVVFVRTAEALAHCVRDGLCVAVDPDLVDSGAVLIENARLHPAQEAKRPFCVLEVSADEVPTRPSPTLMGMIGVIPELPPEPPSPPSPPSAAVSEPAPPGVMRRAWGLLRRAWWGA